MHQLPRRRRLAVAVAAFALVAAACGDDTDQVVGPAGDKAKDAQEKVQGATGAGDKKLSIRAPAPGTSVKGNVVTLDLDVGGVRIVKADGDASGDTGHLHVFIDKEPVPVGEVIPRGPGIIHTTDNPVKVHGLSVGEHRITVVMGDGKHTRLPDLAAATSVTVEGPSVMASAPTTVPAGQPVRVDLKSEGVQITKADGDTSFRAGHYHIFVDRDPTPPGETVPPKPEDGSIIHTAESSVDLPPLAPGEHTIWVILGNGAHVAFDPPVREKLTITVTS